MGSILLLLMAASGCSSDQQTGAKSYVEVEPVKGKVESLEVSTKHINWNINLIRQQRVFDFQAVSKAQENWTQYVDNHCKALALNGDGMIDADKCHAEKAQARALELTTFVID